VLREWKFEALHTDGSKRRLDEKNRESFGKTKTLVEERKRRRVAIPNPLKMSSTSPAEVLKSKKYSLLGKVNITLYEEFLQHPESLVDYDSEEALVVLTCGNIISFDYRHFNR
jgi:hypothetical protein